ncbi:YceD family protein [Rhodobacter sp. NSM]|uniref:YceD family protein n=1 Tax=Rhodobacter sp. NSM TaxID=3457501 RepID=UPI003FD3B62C
MPEPVHTSTADLPLSCPFRVAALSASRPTRFKIVPDAEIQGLVAALLGISGVRGMSFAGEIRPAGRRDFELEGRLEATVVQPCSVTLTPVTTRIEETVSRRYLADYTMPEADEVEVPEDDSEPLPDVIDAGAVAVEALALALPLYPRAPGAELDDTTFAPPGVVPLADADLRPFAGLADLRRRMGGDEPGRGGDGDG